ncbi:MAG: site-2 protease family protein [Candidatus Omnitrophota bacterium]|nr:site-2 protease family protein [Candidatus Omnitrophota bacterium]
MGFISLLFNNPVAFFVLAFLLLYSIIAHEIAHGWVAHLFGDDTALRYGRLTLNPVPHIDPIGALLLLFVGFGWAKPVPVNYYALRNRAGLLCVALAGCAANILIAAVAMFLMQFKAVSLNPGLSLILPVLITINIMLGALNLIPIPPLDGSKVLMSFLPFRAQEKLALIEPYGFFILIFLLVTGLLNPLVVFIRNIIYALISLPFIFFR